MKIWLIVLAACGSSPPASTAKPASAPPAPVAKPEVDCDAVVDRMSAAFGKPLEPGEHAKMTASCRDGIAKNDPNMRCMSTAMTKPEMLGCLSSAGKSHEAPRSMLKDQVGAMLQTIQKAHDASGTYPAGSASRLPAQGCCAAGTHGKCAVTDAWSSDPVWRALGITLDEPTLYQFSYTSDGQTFHLEAAGDLDCDKIFVTYKFDGTTVNGQLDVKVTEPTNPD